MDIELAVHADAAAIAALSRVEIEHDLPWRWTPRRVAAAIAAADTNVAVARDGGRLAGFGVMEYGDESAHLVLFAVDRARRREGVGSALLAWLERVAAVAGIGTVRLEARRNNAAALAFYRRHGYRLSAAIPGMYLGLEDGVRLVKHVHNALDVPR